MKKILWFLLLVFCLSLSSYVIYRLSNSTTAKIFLMNSKMEERHYEPVLGIYDRNNQLGGFNPKDFEHFALVLNNDANWEIEQNLLELVPLDFPVLLTIEFWDSAILNKVSNGEYDQKIERFFTPLLKGRTNIYVRWSPEMEVPAMKLPWAGNPEDFIRAYKKFSREINKISPTARMVFSPAGYPGVLEFYPGNPFVDAASITLKSRSEQHLQVREVEDSLPNEIRRKLHRLRFIDHPVFVLGSSYLDERSFKTGWIDEAFKTIMANSDIIYSSENFNYSPTPKTGNQPHNFLIGLYDPQILLVNEKGVSLEHIFLNFSNVETGKFKVELEKASARDNDLILTVEPGIDKDGVTDYNVLENILQGKYDKTINEFYCLISGINKEVYLRFAHEMEIPISRYAWQSKDPLEYIKAFRYFMNFPDSRLSHIKRIWGPAGDRGSIEYWPGTDVVDYISISIYGLPDKNNTDPARQESFSKIFHRKSRRMRFINKPIFITEFGVKGNEQLQTKWLMDAAQTLNEQPQVIGISYFNMTDVPGAWGEIKPPDWSISKKTFEKFLEALQRNDF